MKAFIRKFWHDERGDEVLEYALIAGLIIVAAIAVVSSVGSKMVDHFNKTAPGNPPAAVSNK